MTPFDDLGIIHPGLFCGAVVLLNLTPGPDTAFIVGQSVARGRRAGLMAVLGISLGCAVHTLALALGLSAVIAASAEAFMLIKIAGAAYLIYLGVRMIVATRRARGAAGAAVTANAAPPVADGHARIAPPSARRTFAQGFITNVLNPKVVLFFLSFFPQFVSIDSTSKGLAFAVLGGVMIAISTIYNGTVAWLAGSITRHMHGAPRVKVWLERLVGTAFIALGARLVMVER